MGVCGGRSMCVCESVRVSVPGARSCGLLSFISDDGDGCIFIPLIPPLVDSRMCSCFINQTATIQCTAICSQECNMQENPHTTDIPQFLKVALLSMPWASNGIFPRRPLPLFTRFVFCRP